jgi:PiT family inorganic phosphate transporter
MTAELILILAGLFGFYMAFNIGANDVANAMGTSVGSRALTIKQAILAAAVFEFAGAFFAGGAVTQTIGSDLLHLSAFEPGIYVYGMLAVLLATAIWLHLATHLGLPVSTTHSVVGAVWGFGVAHGGMDAVVLDKAGQIVASWFVSPLSGLVLALVLYRIVDRQILSHPAPLRATRRLAPVFVFIVIAVLALSMIYKGLKGLRLDLGLPLALGLSLAAGLLAALVAGRLFARRLDSAAGDPIAEKRAIERVFIALQVLTACYVAFAHGANDVSNAVGPLSSVAAIVTTGLMPTGDISIPSWVMLTGAVGIVIGLAALGHKVIATVGSKITEMTPSRGFAAQFGAATTVLIASKLGLPISTTHTLVGAVIGVGLARGLAHLDFRVLRDIMASWFITLPFTGVLTVVLYKLLTALL